MQGQKNNSSNSYVKEKSRESQVSRPLTVEPNQEFTPSTTQSRVLGNESSDQFDDAELEVKVEVPGQDILEVDTGGGKSPTDGKKRIHKTSVYDLIEAGYLSAGDAVTFSCQGQEYEGKLQGDGQISYDNKIFSTPSEFCVYILQEAGRMQHKGTHAWASLRVNSTLLAEVRQQYEQKQSKRQRSDHTGSDSAEDISLINPFEPEKAVIEPTEEQLLQWAQKTQLMPMIEGYSRSKQFSLLKQLYERAIQHWVPEHHIKQHKTEALALLKSRKEPSGPTIEKTKTEYRLKISAWVEGGTLPTQKIVEALLNYMKSAPVEPTLSDMVFVLRLLANTQKKLLTSFVELDGLNILKQWLVELKISAKGLQYWLQALSKMPITYEILQRSAIGKTVASLEKIQHEGVSQMASRLKQRWMELVRVARESNVPARTATTTRPSPAAAGAAGSLRTSGGQLRTSDPLRSSNSSLSYRSANTTATFAADESDKKSIPFTPQSRATERPLSVDDIKKQKEQEQLRNTVSASSSSKAKVSTIPLPLTNIPTSHATSSFTPKPSQLSTSTQSLVSRDETTEQASSTKGLSSENETPTLKSALASSNRKKKKVTWATNLVKTLYIPRVKKNTAFEHAKLAEHQLEKSFATEAKQKKEQLKKALAAMEARGEWREPGAIEGVERRGIESPAALTARHSATQWGALYPSLAHIPTTPSSPPPEPAPPDDRYVRPIVWSLDPDPSALLQSVLSGSLLTSLLGNLPTNLHANLPTSQSTPTHDSYHNTSTNDSYHHNASTNDSYHHSTSTNDSYHHNTSTSHYGHTTHTPNQQYTPQYTPLKGQFIPHTTPHTTQYTSAQSTAPHTTHNSHHTSSASRRAFNPDDLRRRR